MGGHFQELGEKNGLPHKMPSEPRWQFEGKHVGEV
jgi:hypothetical protein